MYYLFHTRFNRTGRTRNRKLSPSSGLIFIGAGMVTGGDFGDVIQGIVIDLQGRLSGIIAEEPIIG